MGELNLENLKGKLKKHNGESVEVETLKSGEIIGVYFSAHWCPPCRGFTPQLVEWYNNLKAEGKSFEIIFVSSDRDEASFNEYFGTMPWAALEFSDRAMKEQLCQQFGVRGIPTFILFDNKGNIITQEGRSKVTSDKDGKDFPYTQSKSTGHKA